MVSSNRLQNISTAYFRLENPLKAENFIKRVSVRALNLLKCISYCTFIVPIVFFIMGRVTVKPPSDCPGDGATADKARAVYQKIINTTPLAPLENLPSSLHPGIASFLDTEDAVPFLHQISKEIKPPEVNFFEKAKKIGVQKSLYDYFAIRGMFDPRQNQMLQQFLTPIVLKLMENTFIKIQSNYQENEQAASLEMFFRELCEIFNDFKGNESTEMHIFVKNLKGKMHTLGVNENTTIKELQSLLFTKTGCSLLGQRIIFAGKDITLFGTNTLENFNIQKESTLHDVASFGGRSIYRGRFQYEIPNKYRREEYKI